MKDIAVLGAGKIGSTIAELLATSGDYAVTLIERDQEALDRLEIAGDVTRLAVDVRAGEDLARAVRGRYAVLSAAPFHLTTAIAAAAFAAGAHYLDLTEDVASTKVVRDLAREARTAFIPQCGLAPGFVSIAAHDIAQSFETLDCIRLRVGALPRYPDNALGYNLTWSTEGVINEYIEPCEAIVEGERRLMPALEECESLSIDGVAYEAFNTSGGLGSLCDVYAGRVRELNYRTMRYPGHAAIMKLLLRDLRLGERRTMLRAILEHALPATTQDVVVIFVTVIGTREGRLTQETLARRIDNGAIAGRRRWSTGWRCAGSICAVLGRSGGVRPRGLPGKRFRLGVPRRPVSGRTPPGTAGGSRQITCSGARAQGWAGSPSST